MTNTTGSGGAATGGAPMSGFGVLAMLYGENRERELEWCERQSSDVTQMRTYSDLASEQIGESGAAQVEQFQAQALQALGQVAGGVITLTGSVGSLVVGSRTSSAERQAADAAAASRAAEGLPPAVDGQAVVQGPVNGRLPAHAGETGAFIDAVRSGQQLSLRGGADAPNGPDQITQAQELLGQAEAGFRAEARRLGNLSMLVNQGGRSVSGIATGTIGAIAGYERADATERQARASASTSIYQNALSTVQELLRTDDEARNVAEAGVDNIMSQQANAARTLAIRL